MFCIFFFNSTATTDIYTYVHTLSLHDALPIYTVAGRDPLAVATSFGELEKLMAARAMLWVEADDRGLTPAKADNPYWTTRPEGPPASFSDRFELGEHWKIGRAQVCTPQTNEHLVCRLFTENKNDKRNKHK